ncbi:MAG TPA: phage major capsid protein [Caldimonas sp.]|nr:phage major capsid protein [Caldimonas sp.]
MPQLGTGVMPAASPLGNELSAITRRAFVPKLVVQIYNTSALLAALIANAQPATGGVSSVTVPVQGSQMVNMQWVGYDGTFNQPTVQPGIQNAEFNLKAAVVPIPYLGFEGLVQQDHDIVPLATARMNDAGNVYCDGVATALLNNYSNNQQIIGLPGAIDDATNLVSYGGINRNTNTFWKAKRYNASSAAPTRALVMQYITGAVKSCGELPSFGVMGPGTWQSLANDYLPNESYVITPEKGFDDEPWGARSAFRALMVAGVPIYLDPYVPEGTMYLFNAGYGAFYIHERAAFAFTGFESTLSNNQIGYIGAVVSLLELVITKPKACVVVTGFTFQTI